MHNRWNVVMVGGLMSLALVAGCSSSNDEAKDKKSSKSTTTTLPKFQGKESPTFCPALKKVTAQSELLAAPPAATEAAQKAKWDTAVDVTGQLAAEAPGEIKADAEAVAKAFVTIRDAVSEYGYDAAKLPQSEQTALVSGSVQQSAQRLNAYDAQLCGGAGGTTPTT